MVHLRRACKSAAARVPTSPITNIAARTKNNADFVQAIAGTAKFYDAGHCRGYVSGVADIIVEKKTEACFTTDEAGPKVNQLVDIVRAYLRDHPEKEICQPTLSSLLH
jgi:hypothetical protein